MTEETRQLRRLIAGHDLGSHEMRRLVGRLMDGELSREMQAGLLVALAAKGETVEEIAGAAEAMRGRLVPVPHEIDDLVDTCGTGGDGHGTFNVSTAAALVAAAAGARIAKHGNRSVSSRSGSADVLTALGVRRDLAPAAAARCLEEVGIAFLFAPRYHPAMREVAPVRQALGVRTLFNLLGPLTNPAGARRQLIGVYDDELVPKVARVLARLGCDHGLVVHGADGLDEISTTTATRVAEVRGDEVRLFEVQPEELGVRRASLEELAGGGPEENAAALLAVLEGEGGAARDITLVNAAAALRVAGRAEEIADGVELAREAIDGGAARETLERLRRFTRSAAPPEEE
ncbi:MAG: anthranilate phosphoribosyltransferase [Thermoanaerobaculia bacterium]|nr:anthranilate phosphoribosyltransferase [Thermoanaerobaculia bacterium]